MVILFLKYVLVVFASIGIVSVLMALLPRLWDSVTGGNKEVYFKWAGGKYDKLPTILYFIFGEVVPISIVLFLLSTAGIPFVVVVGLLSYALIYKTLFMDEGVVETTWFTVRRRGG